MFAAAIDHSKVEVPITDKQGTGVLHTAVIVKNNLVLLFAVAEVYK